MKQIFVCLQVTHSGEIGLLQHWIFVGDFGEPVNERHDGNARRPHLRRLGHAHHGHVTAVASAHQDQFLGSR